MIFQGRFGNAQLLLNSGYATGRYYGVEGYAVGPNFTVAAVANRLYGFPFVCRWPTTFTRIGIEVTIGAAGSARLGIYNMAGGLPTTLLVDAGEVDTTSAAILEATISQFLPLGFYFLACAFSATPTVRSNAANAFFSQALIGGGPSDSGGADGTVYAVHTYGVLPTTFGAPTYDVLSKPAMWLRKV